MAGEKDLVKSLADMLDRKTTDETLAILSELLQTLNMTVERIADANQGMVTSHVDFGKSQQQVIDAVSQLSIACERLAGISRERAPQVNVSVDMSEVAKGNEALFKLLAHSEIQNQAILDAIAKMSKSTTSDGPVDYTSLIGKLVSSLETNNSLLQTATKAIDYSDHMKQLIAATGKKPTGIIFERGDMNSNRITGAKINY